MTPRVWFGLIAAVSACGIGLDAWLSGHDYPLYHRLFNGEWQLARNAIYVAFSMLAAAFGYLALNYKEREGG